MNDLTKLVTFLKNWWVAIQKHTYSVSVDNFPEYPEFPEIPETIIPEYPTEIKVSNLEEIKPIDKFADIVKAIEKQSKELKTGDQNIVGELKAILEEVRKEEEDLTPEVIKKISELIKSVDSKSIDFSVLENELRTITETINSVKEYDEVRVKLNSKQFEKLSKTTATAITSGTSGGAKEDTLQQIEDIVTDTYCGSTRKAIGVRGRTDAGVCERLATQADQVTGNNILSFIYNLFQSLVAHFISNVYVRNKKEDSGILALGTGFGESNTSISTLKNQTQNVQRIVLDESSGAPKINLVSDPRKYPFAEINQISISGFNYSEDTRLWVRYWAYNIETSAYYQVWANCIEYGSAEGMSFNDQIKFMPNIVAEWHDGDEQYGYIEITESGNILASTEYDLEILVTLTPFNKAV